MENEILLQILSELKSLNVRQINMEQRQNSIGEELMAFQEFTMQKFERLEKRFDGLEGRFNGLENRFDGLENGQKKLNLIIENEIRPSIQVLAEGQSQMQGQMNQMQGQMEQMQGQMRRIDDKVTWHDDIIFKRVK